MKYVWIQNIMDLRNGKHPIVLLGTNHNFRFSDRVYIKEGICVNGKNSLRASFIGYALTNKKNEKVQKLEILNDAINSIKNSI